MLSLIVHLAVVVPTANGAALPPERRATVERDRRDRTDVDDEDAPWFDQVPTAVWAGSLTAGVAFGLGATPTVGLAVAGVCAAAGLLGSGWLGSNKQTGPTLMLGFAGVGLVAALGPWVGLIAALTTATVVTQNPWVLAATMGAGGAALILGGAAGLVASLPLSLYVAAYTSPFAQRALGTDPLLWLWPVLIVPPVVMMTSTLAAAMTGAAGATAGATVSTLLAVDLELGGRE